MPSHEMTITVELSIPHSADVDESELDELGETFASEIESLTVNTDWVSEVTTIVDYETFDDDDDSEE